MKIKIIFCMLFLLLTSICSCTMGTYPRPDTTPHNNSNVIIPNDESKLKEMKKAAIYEKMGMGTLPKPTPRPKNEMKDF